MALEHGNVLFPVISFTVRLERIKYNLEPKLRVSRAQGACFMGSYVYGPLKSKTTKNGTETSKYENFNYHMRINVYVNCIVDIPLS